VVVQFWLVSSGSYDRFRSQFRCSVWSWWFLVSEWDRWRASLAGSAVISYTYGLPYNSLWFLFIFWPWKLGNIQGCFACLYIRYILVYICFNI